jgi:hypothetical protein
MKTKRVYIAATRQNDGKTAMSLGLICAFSEKNENVGFIKPVGQRYLIEDGEKIDEDSLLIRNVCNLPGNIKDMSPVAIERGFTKKYILNNNSNKLELEVKRAFGSIAKKKDLVVIEGTGHAGVGSVFDLSNARVASILKSKVVLVAGGGVGRPIDEIMLNKALFDKEKVEIAGVIINKVLPEKYKKINSLIRTALNKKGLNVLGVIPYYRMLSKPTVQQILDEEKGIHLLCGQEAIENSVDKIIVGAMEPHEALNYITSNSLVITPGDREDIILTCMSTHLASYQRGKSISGIILTGGIRPHKSIMNLIKKSGIPVLQAKEDTYTITSKIHDLIIKVKPCDKEKAELIKKMVKDYVDIEMLYDAI